MTAASFGGLLKDFRIRKGLTQQDIAYAMGWSEQSRLSRIEQGATHKPQRETIDRLCKVLKLDRREASQLLLAGGYLPTPDEISTIRDEARKLLQDWRYPAYLLDFSWRMIAWNSPVERVYAITPDISEYVHKNTPNSLELIFDPEFPQNKYIADKKELTNWHNLLTEKLVRFRLMHQTHTSEKWYQQLFAKMMKNKLFVKVWQNAQEREKEHGIANYEHKLLVDPQDTENRLNFHIFRSSLLEDLRFEVNYHIPGDSKTLASF